MITILISVVLLSLILDVIETKVFVCFFFFFPCPKLQQEQRYLHFYPVMKYLECFKTLAIYFAKYKGGSCA